MYDVKGTTTRPAPTATVVVRGSSTVTVAYVRHPAEARFRVGVDVLPPRRNGDVLHDVLSRRQEYTRPALPGKSAMGSGPRVATIVFTCCTRRPGGVTGMTYCRVTEVASENTPGSALVGRVTVTGATLDAGTTHANPVGVDGW
jgi:hypothetical protein